MCRKSKTSTGVEIPEDDGGSEDDDAESTEDPLLKELREELGVLGQLVKEVNDAGETVSFLFCRVTPDRKIGKKLFWKLKRPLTRGRRVSTIRSLHGSGEENRRR